MMIDKATMLLAAYCTATVVSCMMLCLEVRKLKKEREAVMAELNDLQDRHCALKAKHRLTELSYSRAMDLAAQWREQCDALRGAGRGV